MLVQEALLHVLGNAVEALLELANHILVRRLRDVRTAWRKEEGVDLKGGGGNNIACSHVLHERLAPQQRVLVT
jgi:hypothetical protein